MLLQSRGLSTHHRHEYHVVPERCNDLLRMLRILPQQLWPLSWLASVGTCERSVTVVSGGGRLRLSTRKESTCQKQRSAGNRLQ